MIKIIQFTFTCRRFLINRKRSRGGRIKITGGPPLFVQPTHGPGHSPWPVRSSTCRIPKYKNLFSNDLINLVSVQQPQKQLILSHCNIIYFSKKYLQPKVLDIKTFINVLFKYATNLNKNIKNLIFQFLLLELKINVFSA